MNSTAELEPIAALDLAPIKVKLMHKESGEGWSLEQVNEVEIEYRRFLQLLKLFPDEPMAPRFDVDIFWHYHILDTLKYAVDCERIFGYFLHHYPYSGLGGDADDAGHDRHGARTQELYEATFSEAYIRQEKPYAVTKYSKAIAQNDRSYSVRSPSGSAMAWCETATQNARSYSLRTVSGAAKMAWCETAARPLSGSANAAWCETVAQNDRSAWCETIAQNGHADQVRPMSAIAA